MNFRRYNYMILTLFLAVVGSGCSNPGQYVDRPNAGNTVNPARNVTTSGVNVTANPGGDENDALFGSFVTLTYYQGINPSNEIKNTRVALHNTDGRQLRISASNLPSNMQICVITGVQYSNDPYGIGTFFLDIGEERCGTLTNGLGTFSMVRSDFNVVTVIRADDLNAFTYWATDFSAPANSYPSMSQGLIGGLLPFPTL